MDRKAKAKYANVYAPGEETLRVRKLRAIFWEGEIGSSWEEQSRLLDEVTFGLSLEQW